MIAVSADLQLQGLGRCWSTAVVHNNIYLQCPTTKSNHAFRVGSGHISMIIGNSLNCIPVPIAKEDVDDAGNRHIRFSTTEEQGIKSYTDMGKRTAEGWSGELALKATPTLCTVIVEMILSSKSKDDFHKVLADVGLNDRITIKRLASTGQYEIELDGESVDLEHILHILMEQKAASEGLVYHWNASKYEDVIDENTHYLRSYFGRERS